MREPMTEEEIKSEKNGAEPQTVGEQATAELSADQPNPQNPNMKWYIIHTYSGFERKVKESLESRVRAYPELEAQDRPGADSHRVGH